MWLCLCVWLQPFLNEFSDNGNESVDETQKISLFWKTHGKEIEFSSLDL